MKRIEFLKGDYFKFSLKFGERFWVTQQVNWRPKEYCKHHCTQEAHDCYYISCDTAIWSSKQGWKWRVDLPPPEARDEDENWNEEMKVTYTVHIDISLLLQMRSLWYWTNCQSII